MKSDEYINITRNILHWEWKSSPSHFALLIHCLLEACDKETKLMGKVIRPRTIATSYRALSMKTGVSVTRIRKALKDLESGGYVKIDSRNNNTFIELLCWDDFIKAPEQKAPEAKPVTKKESNHLAGEVVDLWNKTLGLKIKKNVLYLPPKNVEEIHHLKKALPDIESYKNLFEKIETTKLYIERDKYTWFSLPWLIDENRVLEILAGKWDMPDSNSEVETITFTEEEQKALDEKYYGN